MMSLSRQMMTKPSTSTMFGKLWSSIIGEHFLSLYFSKTVSGTSNGLNAPSLISNSRLEDFFFSLPTKICQIFMFFQSPSQNSPDFHSFFSLLVFLFKISQIFMNLQFPWQNFPDFHSTFSVSFSKLVRFSYFFQFPSQTLQIFILAEFL